jgi:hypothetical protein
MSEPIFKPPQEVLDEIFKPSNEWFIKIITFGTVSEIKLDKTGYWVLVSFAIAFACIFLFIFRNDIFTILFTLGTALYLTDFVKLKLLFECVKKNIGIILGPVLLGVILFYATRDPKALMGNTNSYIIFISTIVVVCFGAYSSLPDFSTTPSLPFLVGGILLSLIAMASYFSSYITPSVVNAVSNVLRVIFLLIVVVGLAIGYKLFSERIKSLTGWPGFFVNFLFYIPCLLSDGLEYLLQQYRITPNIVFVLLIIELILALCYFYIPKLIYKSINKTAIVLQNNPVYLNKETNVGNIENFAFKPISDKIIDVDQDSIDKLYRRNYCINMWVFLNIQPSSNSAYVNETTIFNYNNHPRITHRNESDKTRQKHRNVYTFYFSNTQDGTSVTESSNLAKYEINIPDQKWNLLSFNYFESKVDLYINGNLERTFYFANNIPDYSAQESVLLGSDDGVMGAICNVTYSKKPLSYEQIATLYNTNYLKNPPVNFIE